MHTVLCTRSCGVHQLLTQRHRLARPFSPRQPISGHPGRVRYRAAEEDDLVPGQGAFRTRDELVDSNFSTAQAESLTKLFPSGSTLAKFFEAQELREKERALKEEKKVQEVKEKERVEDVFQEINNRLDKQILAVKNMTLVIRLLILVLLVQDQGFVGALNALFKAVFRL